MKLHLPKALVTALMAGMVGNLTVSELMAESIEYNAYSSSLSTRVVYANSYSSDTAEVAGILFSNSFSVNSTDGTGMLDQEHLMRATGLGAVLGSEGFTISFDLKGISGNPWCDLLSLATNDVNKDTFENAIQLQLDNTGNLHMYHTSETAASFAGGSTSSDGTQVMRTSEVNNTTFTIVYDPKLDPNTNGGAIRLYLNGTLNKTISIAYSEGQTPSTAITGIFFGSAPSGTGRKLTSAEFDNLTIWKTALTEKQVGNILIHRTCTEGENYGWAQAFEKDAWDVLNVKIAAKETATDTAMVSIADGKKVSITDLSVTGGSLTMGVNVDSSLTIANSHFATGAALTLSGEGTISLSGNIDTLGAQLGIADRTSVTLGGSALLTVGASTLDNRGTLVLTSGAKFVLDGTGSFNVGLLDMGSGQIQDYIAVRRGFTYVYSNGIITVDGTDFDLTWAGDENGVGTWSTEYSNECWVGNNESLHFIQGDKVIFNTGGAVVTVDGTEETPIYALSVTIKQNATFSGGVVTTNELIYNGGSLSLTNGATVTATKLTLKSKSCSYDNIKNLLGEGLSTSQIVVSGDAKLEASSSLSEFNTNRSITGDGTISVTLAAATDEWNIGNTTTYAKFDGTIELHQGRLTLGNTWEHASGGTDATMGTTNSTLKVYGAGSFQLSLGGGESDKTFNSNVWTESGANLCIRDGHAVWKGDIHINELGTSPTTATTTLNMHWAKKHHWEGLVSGGGVFKFTTSDDDGGNTHRINLKNNGNTFAGTYELAGSHFQELALYQANAAASAMINMTGNRSDNDKGIALVVATDRATIAGLSSGSTGTGSYFVYGEGDGAHTLTINQSTDTTFKGVFKDKRDSSTSTLALVKTGSGRLELTGANTATGGLTVNGGTVVLGGTAGTWAGTITVGENGTLDLHNSAATTHSSNITVNGNLIVSAEETLTGVVSGTGNTTVNNNLTLGNAASSINLVSVTEGKKITGAGKIVIVGGDTGKLVIKSQLQEHTGTVEIGNSKHLEILEMAESDYDNSKGLTQGNITIAAGGKLTLKVGDGLGYYKDPTSGNPTEIITMTGDSAEKLAQFEVSGSRQTLSTQINLNSNTKVFGTGSLESFNLSTQDKYHFNVAGTNNTVELGLQLRENGFKINVAEGGELTFSGKLSHRSNERSGAVLTKSGEGTLFMSNTVGSGDEKLETGMGVAVTGGVLKYGGQEAGRGTTGEASVTVSDGAMIEYAHTDASVHTFSGTINLDGANAVMKVSNGNQAQNEAAISGRGKIQVDGGSLTLTEANTYSGGTTVEGGTLVVNADGTLGAGDVTVKGGTLAYNGGEKSLANVNFTTTGILEVRSGTVTLGKEMEVTRSDGNIFLGSKVDSKKVTGTLKVLSGGSLEYDGLTITRVDGTDGSISAEDRTELSLYQSGLSASDIDITDTTSGRKINASLTGVAYTNTKGGAEMLGKEKTFSSLELNGGLLVETKVTLTGGAPADSDTASSATVSEKGVLELSGESASVKVAGITAKVNGSESGTAKKVTINSAGISGITNKDGTLKALGEMTSMTLAFAAENAKISNVTLRDVTITNGAVTMENVKAIASTFTEKTQEAAPALMMARTLSAETSAAETTTILTATAVQTGGTINKSLTVDIDGSIFNSSNAGKTLEWTIFENTMLGEDFTLKLGDILQILVANTEQTVTLSGSLVNPDLLGGDETSLVLGSDNVTGGAINTGTLITGEVGNLVLTVTNIPEPAGGTLSVLALAALAARRRRK